MNPSKKQYITPQATATQLNGWYTVCVPLSRTSVSASSSREVYTKKRGHMDAMNDTEDAEEEMKGILW